jgi:general stress protein CsbA|tara:strand:+ start:1476 stop:1955 length:480 start_codon:yes stop_codon:yes gene_type:complete
MPDWISHILIALIISKIFNIKEKSLLVLGSLLPDFILKLQLLSLFFPKLFEIRYALIPFHAPFGLFLLTIIITPLFKHNYKKTFSLISMGWILHLIADSITKHIFMGETFFLLPFSFKSLEAGIIWPEQYLFVLVPLVVIYLITNKLTKKANFSKKQKH